MDRASGRRLLVLALIPMGLAFGALAGSIGARGVADLAVGWVVIGSGVAVEYRRPGDRIGLLMAATGFAWFLGSFVPAALYLHRGPLVHVLLAFPTGRLRGRIARATVLGAYLDGAIGPIGTLAPATIILMVAMVLAAASGVARSSGPVRRGRAAGATAALAIGVVLTLGSLRTILHLGIEIPVLSAYQVVLATVAVGLVAALLRGGWSQAAVTDLVVDLGERAQSGLLQDRLAAALGDPSLVIGYWVGEAAGYVDETGRQIQLPRPGSGLAMTPVGTKDERIAVLVHDEAILGDPLLIESVAAAARIDLTNARVQVEIQDRVAELAASRRRLVEAADSERRRLERELQAGAAGRLATVERLLGGAAAEASGPLVDAIGAVKEDLRRAEAELRDFARGVYPRSLTEGGLRAAVRELANGASVPVSVEIADERLSPIVETTGYFVCSEALANVTKHANASHVAIAATQADGKLRLVIQDDGVGGADLGTGSGLRGLADRVDAVGGELRVHSPAGGGTRLLAEVPLS